LCGHGLNKGKGGKSDLGLRDTEFQELLVLWTVFLVDDDESGIIHMNPALRKVEPFRGKGVVIGEGLPSRSVFFKPIIPGAAKSGLMAAEKAKLAAPNESTAAAEGMALLVAPGTEKVAFVVRTPKLLVVLSTPEAAVELWLQVESSQGRLFLVTEVPISNSLRKVNAGFRFGLLSEC
jgi:hypothetical protein